MMTSEQITTSGIILILLAAFIMCLAIVFVFFITRLFKRLKKHNDNHYDYGTS